MKATTKLDRCPDGRVRPVHLMRLGVGEYARVMSRAGLQGWLGSLVEAHTTSCTQAEAMALLKAILKDGYTIRWKDLHRGRARYSRSGYYTVTLPAEPGTRIGKLRVGIVIHEAAHVLDHRANRRFGHRHTFCNTLSQLVRFWRASKMPTTNFRPIYERHAGPFALSLIVAGKGDKHDTEVLRGPYTAAEADAKAIALVGITEGKLVLRAYVYSDKEGQFIGACYERGQTYEPCGRVDVADQQQEGSLRETREEPLREVDADVLPEQGSDVEARRPTVRFVQTSPRPGEPVVTSPMTERAKRPFRPSTPRGGALQVAAGKDEAWPKSEAAQVVRRALDARGAATAPELLGEIGHQLQGLGIQFPASLISRLKQAGLIVPKVEEAGA